MCSLVSERTPAVTSLPSTVYHPATGIDLSGKSTHQSSSAPWTSLDALCEAAVNHKKVVESPCPSPSADGQSTAATYDSVMYSSQSSISSISSMDSGHSSDSSSSPPPPVASSSCGLQFSSTIVRDGYDRSIEESLVASALLDLASQGGDSTVNQQASQLLIKATDASYGALAVKSNPSGHRVLQLPHGMEFLLTKPEMDSRVGVPENYVNIPFLASSAMSSLKPIQYLVADKVKIKPEKDPFACNNNNSGNQLISSLTSGMKTSTGTVLQPNVYHVIATSLNGKGVVTDASEVKKLLPSSMVFQSNGHNIISGGNINSGSPGKKRGRKKVYDSDGSGSVSNPIKEFRQRQRNRERMEDERLAHLEEKYLANRLGDFPESLEELYSSQGLNIKFPRVKTTMKRGKAANDFERSNRKKECARRDSKNYRERAKAKRDLVLRKINFLQELLLRASLPRYQFVFK